MAEKLPPELQASLDDFRTKVDSLHNGGPHERAWRQMWAIARPVIDAALAKSDAQEREHCDHKGGCGSPWCGDTCGRDEFAKALGQG